MEHFLNAGPTLFKLTKFYADQSLAGEVNFGELEGKEISVLTELAKERNVAIFLMSQDMFNSIFSDLEQAILKYYEEKFQNESEPDPFS